MRLLRLMCVVSILGLLASVTHVRTQAWQSDYTVWADAAGKAPLRPRPRINYGRAAVRAGDLDLGRQQFVAAIHLSSDPRRSAYQRAFSFALASSNLAHVLNISGQQMAALDILNTAIAEQPYFPHARFNRAVLRASIGDCLGAYDDFQVAKTGLPDATMPVCHE